jgi:hypothetical protein
VVDEPNKTFEQVMNTRLAQTDRPRDSSKLTGAVLVFRAGINKDDARVLLSQLNGSLESSEIREFDPQWGGPVWYIP